MKKIHNKNIILIVYAIFSSIAAVCMLLGKAWIGGDSVPFDFILQFVINNISGVSYQWGLSGPTVGLSVLTWLPYALVLQVLFFIFGNISYTIFLAIFLFVFLYGWHRLFYSIQADTFLASLLAFVMLTNPISWLLFNRNIFFLIILFSCLPWLLLSVKKVFEIGNRRSWIEFSVLSALISAGLLNTGYAIPAALLSAVYILIFVNWIPQYKRVFGVICILIILSIPNIIGQLNFFVNSKALQDDYWNNTVLTKIPLDRHKVSNVFSNVIAGYNWDTLAAYGYDKDNLDYRPWWFAEYKDSSFTILLYIPFVLALLLSVLVFTQSNIYFRKQNYLLAGLLSFAMFCIFMMKSSAGLGGQWFYDYMMNNGWFKMFRSPHLKFGVEYYAVLMLIIAYCIHIINNEKITRIIKFSLAIFVLIFGAYPILTGKYIPILQKVDTVPKEYFEVRSLIKEHKKEWDLGVLLPANDSTWDSNSWGYEGYHILHWLDTGVSFINRNGLSFNEDNLISFYAWMKMGNNGEYDERAIDILREQGYDIVVYDASSDRTARFRKDESHAKNIEWLDSQTDRLKKIRQIGTITMYEINKEYSSESSWKMDVYKQQIIQK